MVCTAENEIHNYFSSIYTSVSGTHNTLESNIDTIGIIYSLIKILDPNIYKLKWRKYVYLILSHSSAAYSNIYKGVVVCA